MKAIVDQASQEVVAIARPRVATKCLKLRAKW
jgi:hypothetical protein